MKIKPNNWFRLGERRSAKSGPSSFALSNKNGAPKRRTTYHTITIWPNHQLFISARRFCTQRKNQSKKHKQLVIYVDHLGFPVKEVAIRHKKVRVRKARSAQKTPNLRLRKTLSYALIAFGLTGVIFFGLQFTHPKNIDVSATGTIPAPQVITPITPKTLPRSHPNNIHIDKIGLDAPIIDVGQKTDGTMETPNVLDYVVGWYKYSPTPGELGPAIIVGHVDSYKNISVFWRLRELVPGDTVTVARDDGSSANFRVDSLRQFDQLNFPSQEVYGNINYAGLRLITCGGTFNHQTGQYDQNTVVFATLIDQ